MHFYRGFGAGAARYFDEGHRGAEAYYIEQARAVVEIDTWRSGERLGTTRLAEAGELARWVEGIDPVTGEVKGIIRAGGKDRQPLRFVEMVVNNPKSLSIIASQNPAVASAYDALLSRQADEIARYLSRVAVTRIGPRGAQREVGNLRVETARVKHLTSREGDPHRHIHLMLNARVMTPDGTWHGLHSAALRQHIGAVNAMGSRILMTDANLRAVLHAEGYTLGQDGEMNEARGAVALFSKRAAMVVANRERIEAAWRAEHPGEQPSQRQLNAWDHQAWTEGRATEGRAETPEQLSERVRHELGAAGFDFTPGRRSITARERSLSVAQVQREDLAEHAVAVLSSTKSAWCVAELTAEVERTVATSGVVDDQQAVAELAEEVGARALERCSSLLDPARQAPTAMSRHLSSEQVREADLHLNLGLAGLAGGEGKRDEEARRQGPGSGTRRRPGRGSRGALQHPQARDRDRPGRQREDDDARSSRRSTSRSRAAGSSSSPRRSRPPRSPPVSFMPRRPRCTSCCTPTAGAGTSSVASAALHPGTPIQPPAASTAARSSDTRSTRTRCSSSTKPGWSPSTRPTP